MTTAVSELTIDGSRLWRSLMEMAKIGPGIAGGNNRQTLTDADAEARRVFRRWCAEAGMTITVDRMGNMFARREGAEPDLPPVFLGSHLDTQPTGGRFDGVLGVLAALETVRTLEQHGIRTRHPIVVVNWTNEEGTRFAPAMLGSGVFAGVHTLEWAHERRDADGKRFGDELARIGFLGEEEASAAHRPMRAYFELHIEQGPILEAEGKDIGVVTHGQGLSWTEVTVTGRDAHTGSTPMKMRRNAGLGMARIMELVDRIAWAHQPKAAGAVGRLEVFPNSRNVIPGKAVFTVDFRSPDKRTIEEMEEELRRGAAEICAAMGLGVTFEKVGAFDPVAFDTDCVETVRRAAERLGYAHMDIVAGAGHDACWINRVAPTAMIMCPCKDGLSHNEAEEISPAWAEKGANVLLQAALDLAGVIA